LGTTPLLDADQACLALLAAVVRWLDKFPFNFQVMGV
jgi:hypothetical protein